MVAEIRVRLQRRGGAEELVEPVEPAERAGGAAPGGLARALQQAALRVNSRLSDLIDAVGQPAAPRHDEESDDGDDDDEPAENSSDAKRKRT